VQATKKNLPFHKLGSWQGVPIFLKSNFLSQVQYSLAIADPTTGFDLPFYAAWLDETNRWHIGESIEKFFQSLATHVEQEQERITRSRQKAEEFEAQARTIFPQHQAWETVLARKQALDRYIDCAASAHSEEALQRVAVMRQLLLETAPKEMTERPQPKNTATHVLPPRNPTATQEEASSSTVRIEATQTEAHEQTIEEIVRTIQHSYPVGSRATVSFGNVDHIRSLKKGKHKNGKNASNQPQSSTPSTKTNAIKGENTSAQSKTEALPKNATKGGSTPAQPQPHKKTGAPSKKATTEKNTPAKPQPQPKTGAPPKNATKGESASLWDLMMEEPPLPPSPIVVPTPTISESAEQLTLF
jgi:hypothetical protein